MRVSRGPALLLSAALHTVGLVVAGWATYGQYREPSAPDELRVTRAYALTFLTLTPPKPRPAPRPAPAPARARREEHPPTAPAAATPPSSMAEQPPPATEAEPAASPLSVQELAPGTTAATLPVVGPPTEPAPEAGPPVTRGLYQAAALVTPAGSACPALPVPSEWGGREVSVAVAFVVDTSGKVDPSKLRVVESPGRHSAGRGFYPRIYVVGTKAGRAPSSMDQAGYDSVVTRAVASHIAGLRFRPALVGGRPVSSLVLVACHRAPGA
jgi:hypothetical protein